MSRKKTKPQQEPQPGDEEPPASPELPAAASPGERADDDPVARLQAERDELIQRLRRVSADYVNYQKRAQRDMDQVRQFAGEEIIKALLPVLDDMERALQAAAANHGEDDPFYRGMQLVHTKMLAALSGFGLQPIESVGKPFDPELHLAILQQPSDDVAPLTILQETQRGYLLKGRPLRPASVVVSRASGPDQP